MKKVEKNNGECSSHHMSVARESKKLGKTEFCRLIGGGAAFWDE